MHESEIIEIKYDESFTFDCNDRVQCFNDCCRDLNQLLTPYDILRLKKNLGLSSSVFLDRYTLRHAGPQTGLPVVTLKPQDPIQRRCPFVASSGCSVYPDRPSSCRMYPVIRSVSRARQPGGITVKYMLIRESHCRGFESRRNRTVDEWLSDQELFPYNENNDAMAVLISIKNSVAPGRLTGKAEQLFYMACYDIDRFREEVFDKHRLADVMPDADAPVSARTDDVEMLKFSMAVVKYFMQNSHVAME